MQSGLGGTLSIDAPSKGLWRRGGKSCVPAASATNRLCLSQLSCGQQEGQQWMDALSTCWGCCGEWLTQGQQGLGQFVQQMPPPVWNTSFLKKKMTSFELVSVNCKIKMTAANSLAALFYSGIALGKIHISEGFFDSLEWAGWNRRGQWQLQWPSQGTLKFSASALQQPDDIFH